MMHSLQALGLAPDADEREVRRAYARRVKAIDPATDPVAFQALREHYEAALAWVRMRPADRVDGGGLDVAEASSKTVEAPAAAAPAPPVVLEPEPEPHVPSEAPAPERGSDLHLADASEPVFSAFFRAVAQEFKYVATAAAALERALEDPRLINLEARARFELRVAQLLVQGWQPGHQFLFVAACDTFHWEQDRSRLSMFGPVGAMLDAAITQSLVFYGQPDQVQFTQQRSLVVRLREDALPSNDTLAKERERLQMLAQRYPHWLRIVTSGANVARWQEALQGLPPLQMRAVPAPAEGSQRPSGTTEWSGFLLLIGILVALANLLGRAPGSATQPPYQMTDKAAAELERFRKLTAPSPPAQPWATLDPPSPPPKAAPASASAPIARGHRRAAGASRPAAPMQAPDPVSRMPNTFDLIASEPVWTPVVPRKEPPNPLKPSRELPTLSDTDPANAPWRKGISYELVPSSPQGPASAPLLGR
ncbi:MAG TPA: hypothetical protein VFL86_18540 [Burkholderiaceae bacterium]|nr:hypothetical protein [Burkholderiaceae bacterium]